ncbi:bifunctional diaminohydroxyphosphoribosylaminopyrimidine deaminase/5-amino-6-(5-phosphoribosylamino)uracil reductase RibD [Ferruginibacter sp. SUN002]|uniref:bifunctional diaminohydroxyphosphoribosylaminopyrimidine deaminase/5-amino-6-(5-phosphoribosylamino)uracil reductase RibD n=1 Tax=Ferruginibacter sp. SUN002 TaxID=2937789 RepID=UPI003D365CF1
MRNFAHLTGHESYMHRCLELAKLGLGAVAPNPMVGAVLVHEGRIIGEGYHQQYGKAHAEVNCINSVSEADRSLIEKSTLYVSLEPCAHFGKTPPCADLIIKNKIPSVVIACTDIYKEVSGKGIQKLKDAGIEVVTGVLENDALELNKRFFTFHQKKRPFIILKWAQSADGKIANADYSSVAISNDQTNKLMHRWRSEEDAILVGTNTALYDNPSLTTRLWEGKNPVRLVIDKTLTLPTTLNLFDKKVKTIVFNTIKHEDGENLFYHKINVAEDFITQILDALYQLNIQSVFVEGGAKLLQSFIDKNLWDEVVVITNEQLNIENGIAAPQFISPKLLATKSIHSDKIEFYKN